METFQKNRRDLHTQLLDFAKNVYYQPPQSVKLTYPCIVYSRSRMAGEYANNQMYIEYVGYKLVYITKDAEDSVPLKILRGIDYCTLDSDYESDNLYHTAFTVNKL